MDGIKRAANRLFNNDENAGANVDIGKTTKRVKAGARQLLGSSSSTSSKEGVIIKPKLVVRRNEASSNSCRLLNRQEALRVATEAMHRYSETAHKRDNLVLPEEFVDRFFYMRHFEVLRALPPVFVANPEITNKIRQILVDWVMAISARFTFECETKHATIAMLDRCLCVMKNLKKDQLQLLAATCAYLACKNEEVNMQHASDFVFMADNCFTVRDVLKMEMRVFAALDFNVNLPTAITFLRSYRFFTGNVADNHTTAKLIMDLAYLDIKLCTKLPSLIALCGTYIANYISGSNFNPVLLRLNGISHDELLSHVVDFIDPIISYFSKNKACAVRKKYSIKLTDAQKEKLVSLKSKLH